MLILSAIMIFLPTACVFLVACFKPITRSFEKTADYPLVFGTAGIFAFACAAILALETDVLWLMMLMVPFKILCWAGLLILGWITVLFFGAWLMRFFFYRQKMISPK